MLFATGKDGKDPDRREFRRVRYAEPVGFTAPQPGAATGSLASDLSPGGLRINLAEFIAAGTELTVQFKLDDGQAVECQARVAWVEKQRFSERYYAGLTFLPLDSAAQIRRHIHRFVDSA
jgi:c-di-GMP-binding flagellar brake protein YcgR